MKKWIKTYLLISVVIVLLFSIFNFAIDPLQQYRKASFYSLTFENELYLNPGLAKTYDYDSVITGSSMVENFILSNTSKILKFNKPIKLCIHGATGYEIKMILERAFKHKEIKNILFGLDLFSYSGEIKAFRNGEKYFPYYLYSNNILDKYKYLVNLDTTKKAISTYIKSLKYKENNPILSYDRMYEWQYRHKKEFGHFDWSKEWVSIYKVSKSGKHKVSNFITSFDYNFLPFIKEQKDTSFTIFYPPYSILAYKRLKQQGKLNAYFKFKMYLASLVEIYPNLKLYDFQVAKEITHDLDNYKDMTHYHQKVNKWMLEQIRDDNYLVTTKNIDKYLQDFEEQIKNYDLNKTLK